ncbi:MAG: hypothetical protein QOE92_1163 [Chloroflexota bacterium]|nr:hypothetical protein [Chloroflexota bacterium]
MELTARRAARIDLTGRRAVLIGLPVAALLTLATSPGLDAWLPFNPAARGADIEAWWYYARQLFGGGAFAPYDGTLPFFHMAPFVVVLAPFAALDLETARHAARAVTALLLVTVVVGWARHAAGGRMPAGAWLLCFSVPVVSAVYIGQVPSSFGLLALSVAIWAQRRDAWWLVGVAAALGTIRSANALPVVAILALAGWGRWRELATAAVAGALSLLPVVALATLRDPTWPTEFQAAVGAYGYGLPSMLSRVVGPSALLLLQALSVMLALAWLRRSRGGPLDLDRSAAVMAMSVLAAPLTAAYAANFLLPGLIRLGSRRGMQALLPVVTVLPWLVAWPLWSTLGPDALVPALEAALVLATLPLLLVRPRGQAALVPAGGPPAPAADAPAASAGGAPRG